MQDFVVFFSKITVLDLLPKVIAGTVKSFPQGGTNPKPDPIPFR
jgi:hypothetical protein